MQTHAHHHHAHHDHQGHHGSQAAAPGLNRVAFSATVHCLTGCAIGEVLGMVIGTALGWGTGATIALAVALAFLFGYALTMLPLLRSGMAFGPRSASPSPRTPPRSPSWRSSIMPSCW
jgi:TctA family transporter